MEASINDVLRTKLRPCNDGIDVEWSRWEHKTFNRHRGVLHWRPQKNDLNCEQIIRAVRDKVKVSFQIAWWRGFGFGVIIDLVELPEDTAAISEFIDTRANSKGTWQWMILICHNSRTVVGIHTWTEGYLSSVFLGLLQSCEQMGFEVGNFKKEKDKLMRFLMGVANKFS